MDNHICANSCCRQICLTKHLLKNCQNGLTGHFGIVDRIGQAVLKSWQRVEQDPAIEYSIFQRGVLDQHCWYFGLTLLQD